MKTTILVLLFILTLTACGRENGQTELVNRCGNYRSAVDTGSCWGPK